MRDLLEDVDGAPLPDEFQRGGIIWKTLRDRLIMGPARMGDLLMIDGACIALAPLWPGWRSSGGLSMDDQTELFSISPATDPDYVPSPDNPFFTTKQVAEMFAVTTATASGWYRDGVLKAVKTPAGLRFPKAVLSRFAQERYGDGRQLP